MCGEIIDMYKVIALKNLDHHVSVGSTDHYSSNSLFSIGHLLRFMLLVVLFYSVRSASAEKQNKHEQLHDIFESARSLYKSSYETEVLMKCAQIHHCISNNVDRDYGGTVAVTSISGGRISYRPLFFQLENYMVQTFRHECAHSQGQRLFKLIDMFFKANHTFDGVRPIPSVSEFSTAIDPVLDSILDKYVIPVRSKILSETTGREIFKHIYLLSGQDQEIVYGRYNQIKDLEIGGQTTEEKVKSKKTMIVEVLAFMSEIPQKYQRSLFGTTEEALMKKINKPLRTFLKDMEMFEKMTWVLDEQLEIAIDQYSSESDCVQLQTKRTETQEL